MRVFAICALLLLAACDDKEVVQAQPELMPCYEIVNVPSSILSPILLNKCSGETWVTLYEEQPREGQRVGPRVYKWYSLHQSDGENVFSGTTTDGRGGLLQWFGAPPQ